MTRLTDLELAIEDIPEHAAADAWKRLNIIAEAFKIGRASCRERV